MSFLFQLSKNPIPEDAAIAGLDFIMSKMDDLKLEHLLFEVRIKRLIDRVRDRETNTERDRKMRRN